MAPVRSANGKRDPAPAAGVWTGGINDYLLSARQAGDLLGVSKNRVGQLRREGRLPAIWCPLGYLYQLRQVENLIFLRQQQGEKAS